MSKELPSTSEFLIIPTNIQAFVVGSPGAPVYDLAPVPREQKDIKDWYHHTKYSFSFSNKLEPLAQGVHLHWALPTALMHSQHEGDAEPEQPYIPNRWLVLRMWHADGDANISSKAWVVESDYVNDDPTSGGSPFLFVKTRPKVSYVGRAIPVEDWSESHPAYGFELKSFGWGDPSFAAFYPACKGVLGFHDKLENVKKGDSLSYVVIGWYSDPVRDPLHRATWQSDHSYAVGDLVAPTTPNGHLYRVTTAGTSGLSKPSWPTTGKITNGTVVFEENGANVLTSLGWSCTNLDGVALPQRTLCHGCVVGVTWQGPDHKYPASPGVASPKVSIGGSAAEAFAALLPPEQAPDPKFLQQVLCAFQHGQATQVSEPDQLGNLLHRHSFGAVSGGKRWSVEPVDRPADAQSTTPPVSAKVQALLNKLNHAQQALDQHARKIESLRSHLFSCWTKWASKQSGPPSRRPSLDMVKTLAMELQTATAGLGDFDKEIKRCKDSVTETLTTEKTGMQLAESSMPPFLHPKDPFVVLQGDGLVGVDRARPQRSDESANGALRGRLAKDVVTGISLSGIISKERSATTFFKLRFPDTAGTPLGDLTRNLALETLLFDPNCSRLIDVETAYAALFKQLQDSLDQEWKSGSNTLNWYGQPPDPLGVTRFGENNPWLPLYLMWQARWAPAYAKVQDGPDRAHSEALDGWELDSDLLGGDLVPQDESVQPSRDEVILNGATIVSALSGKLLATNLKKFAADSLANLERIEQTQVLGQSLGGFNDLLLRQTLGLCLPPVDPYSGQLDTTVWKAIGETFQPTIPVTGTATFLPVRAGALKLMNLYLVGSFGQIRKLIDSSISLSPKVIASAVLPSPPDDYHARFSPRLVQPARLNFDWQPSDSAASGPVCGWIVANFLEKSFAVFSANGAPLGALESVLPALGGKTINSKVTFKWRPIPGSTLAIEGIGNERLRRFVGLVTRFTADEGQVFLELVDLVLRRTEARIPAEESARAVLLGRPLALVHASLGLEVQGLPAGYWKTDGVWKFETEAFEKLRVPVRLGGMNLPADGLVGYLPENTEPCFFASHGATRRISDSSRVNYDQKLSLSCADDSPVSLTLLMDASARVHASTGILPRHSVVLPPEVARLEGLIEEVYFGVAPVLGERPRESASQPTMPRPSDAFGQWSWATRPGLTAQTWHEIRPGDDRARFAENLALTEGWLRLRLRRNQSDAEPDTKRKE